MTQTATREGHINVPGGRVWYKIIGDGPGIPLLLLHGGPGAGHDGFEPLEALADERPVVFYDQLGCGKSDIPGDESLWVIERFADEVGAVRNGLGLDRVHLLGHSWGGFLAIEYMLRRPSGVVSLVLSSTAASAAAFGRESRGLVANLPEETRATIERCEAEGRTDSPEYEAASLVFFSQYLCRLPMPWPDCLMRSYANVQASPTYNFMWGPSEFTVTGNLGEWDRTDRLNEISVPTLILSGRYDEATPMLAAELKAGIPGAESLIFENSAHCSPVEEPEEYQRVVRDFLRRNEAAA
jgi:proline-specific peptidase